MKVHRTLWIVFLIVSLVVLTVPSSAVELPQLSIGTPEPSGEGGPDETPIGIDIEEQDGADQEEIDGDAVYGSLELVLSLILGIPIGGGGNCIH